MNKLYRVLIFLVFFGLGMPCASAANTTSFVPQTVEMNMGFSQNVEIVMDEVPYGISGFNITISVSDPEIAEITAASFPGWNTVTKNSTSEVPSSSVWITSSDGNGEVVAGSKNVSLGNITITGKQAGTANLNISEGSYYDPDYESIPFTDHFIPNTVQGEINVLDPEFPVINSVDLNKSMPNTGDSILVTVNTTDNVSVSEVKANDILLIKQSGSIWNGSIIALEGTHSVNVSSENAAGNVAWDNNTSYTATKPELPDNNGVELQLWTFDANKVRKVPDNIYTANPIAPYISNLSLAYNSTLGSIDSSCQSNDSGSTYITGAYPAVNENLTFTMGVDSSSQ